MDNRKENIMSVEKMRQRSKELSKHLPKESCYRNQATDKRA